MQQCKSRACQAVPTQCARDLHGVCGAAPAWFAFLATLCLHTQTQAGLSYGLEVLGTAQQTGGWGGDVHLGLADPVAQSCQLLCFYFRRYSCICLREINMYFHKAGGGYNLVQFINSWDGSDLSHRTELTTSSYLLCNTKCSFQQHDPY